MQQKFSRKKSLKETLFSSLIKILLLTIFITFAIFLLDKVNFPSPNNSLQEDITNEIIKLK